MDILDNIGNTPLYKINDKINDIYLKFEGANSFGSAKDRSAKYVLNKFAIMFLSILDISAFEHHLSSCSPY